MKYKVGDRVRVVTHRFPAYRRHNAVCVVRDTHTDKDGRPFYTLVKEKTDGFAWPFWEDMLIAV